MFRRIAPLGLLHVFENHLRERDLHVERKAGGVEKLGHLPIQNVVRAEIPLDHFLVERDSYWLNPPWWYMK